MMFRNIQMMLERIPIPSAFSVADRAQSAFDFAVSLCEYLSPSAKDDFYGELIDRLQAEMQPDIVETAGFGCNRNESSDEGEAAEATAAQPREDYTEEEVKSLFEEAN